MSPDADAAQRDLPASVGRYQILERLSTDTSGDVYHGFDPLLERPVILRVFNLHHIDSSATDAIKLAFYEQMRRAGMLSHHGIAALFDGGELPGFLFFANEYVDGKSLRELLSGSPELDLPRRASVIIQMADVFDYAHQSGAFHLTLDPNHVRVDGLMMLKIGGFGVAAVLDAIAAAAGAPAPMSDHYAAPERRRGDSGDHHADLFSLAELAVDVLVDRGTATSLVNDPLEMPRYLEAAGVDAAQWREVFARALADRPADRYGTAADFVSDLLRVLGAGDESRLRWEMSPPIDEAPPLEPDAASVSHGDYPETMMSGMSAPAAPLAPAKPDPVRAAHERESDETMLSGSSDAPTVLSLDHRALKHGAKPPDKD